jgi:hypothetical protein
VTLSPEIAAQVEEVLTAFEARLLARYGAVREPEPLVRLLTDEEMRAEFEAVEPRLLTA